MVANRELKMGRFSVELDLANNDDLALAKAGVISPDQVRRTRVSGVVDTGAARLVLPESVVRTLGLDTSATSKARYADGRVTERAIAKGPHLSYGGREGVFSAVVEPGCPSALIGAIVLEDLDFMVDCVGQRLVPRDPDQIISEIE